MSLRSRIVGLPWVRPVKPNAARARQTTSPLRFMLAETARRGVGVYEARGGRGRFAMRHGTLDVFTFDEVFRDENYAEPAPVRAALARLGRPPRVLDIGANVGMFSAWAVARWPGAQITCVEPDADNLAVLSRTAQASGGGWDIWPVAAAARDGEMAFVGGGQAISHQAWGGEDGAVTVAARDVLPAVRDADLVKIDAEGGEWALLGDPRFAETGAVAVALEYHPEGSPGGDARREAHALLRDAGFATEEVPTSSPAGYGSLWGFRA